MLVLIIILAILVLLLLTKVGVDAAYADGSAFLSVKIGPVSKQLLPKQANPEKPKKPKKEKKPKAEKPEEEKKEPSKKKLKLDLSFVLNAARIGLHALNRFRISLRIDVFHLRFIMASEDPYKTAMTYGYVQSAIGILGPRIRRAFVVRDSQVELGTDFLDSKPDIAARLVLTIRIGRIFGVLFATAFEFLRYLIRRKRRERRNMGGVEKERKSNAPEPEAKSA